MTKERKIGSIIHVSELKDGQLAKIVGWTSREYVNRVVQRYGNHLITIGQSEGKSWTNVFSSLKLTVRDHPDCKVELIKNPFKD